MKRAASWTRRSAIGIVIAAAAAIGANGRLAAIPRAAGTTPSLATIWSDGGLVEDRNGDKIPDFVAATKSGTLSPLRSSTSPPSDQIVASDGAADAACGVGASRPFAPNATAASIAMPTALRLVQDAAHVIFILPRLSRRRIARQPCRRSPV